MANIQEQVENIPGYDLVMGAWEDYAGDHFQTKDPYRETLPDGKTRKRKLPEGATKDEKKSWKSIQRRAWIDDKCFLGCQPVDCGIGLAPVVAFFIPTLGPIVIYVVHARLIKVACDQFDIGPKLEAKLHANILFDLLISLPPIIGALLAWLNGCSTRNAALIHSSVAKKIVQRQRIDGIDYHRQ
ncbi:hypothetical protein PP7435_CHR4-0576 [Komagataella phaffii CBS 7435]|uniref:Uncharacterized protein n=2 Tax=Komagataella phaffii TaxID=460519 RepID=C4R7T3_KOMPG|nr:Hypothetical protein PAS_chr4_0409 [Komagataella phaffii GS115]AOA64797.1 GQ67_04760T0 [Komagataella phaffii]CAH2450958.1 hypothetical protein BQ9382_C4-3020 [Komagataella phaffii CBS 7435]AOA70025.1 GQ68_04732T0 [Komagataella phaffii GS115]CAY71658.1 Hypothetical protein PAS_chr4_0409 [Komagataella phaffii GS115]CCA40738.1 hypothetical protein PP7435_CHR4-0576 [Komagataella phaffii CBS 7435]